MLRDIQNIDYVILLCRDMAKMRAFYKDVMQFALEEDGAHWVKFRVGSGFLTLRPRGRPYDGSKTDESASVQVAFRVMPADVNLRGVVVRTRAPLWRVAKANDSTRRVAVSAANPTSRCRFDGGVITAPYDSNVLPWRFVP